MRHNIGQMFDNNKPYKILAQIDRCRAPSCTAGTWNRCSCWERAVYTVIRALFSHLAESIGMSANVGKIW